MLRPTFCLSEFLKYKYEKSCNITVITCCCFQQKTNLLFLFFVCSITIRLVWKRLQIDKPKLDT